MRAKRHHLEPETAVGHTASRGPLFGRLVAGALGGILLASVAGGVCGLALADPIRDADTEGMTPGIAVLLITEIAVLMHSLVFAVRSRRTAKVWRTLILRTSAVAFATPLAAVVALVRLAVRHEHMSMGPIVYLLLGSGGVVGGVVLRVIGLKIARSPVPTAKTASRAEPAQQRQMESAQPTCPACGAKLLQMTCEDLVLDVCRNGCGGVWFDNFELRQATKSIRSIEEDWLPRTTTNRPIHADPSSKRPCPKCDGIRMLRHLFSDSCHIEIDECPSCGGIWLDSGEFEQIYASMNRQDVAAPHSTPDPETAILMSRLEIEMEQSRQQTQARSRLCKFIGRRYCTSHRNCEL